MSGELLGRESGCEFGVERANPAGKNGGESNESGGFEAGFESEVEAFMGSKDAEYVPFAPGRFRRILASLSSELGLDAPARPKIIQILGTNGKGSTGRFLTLMLLQNGFRALHFTSPHLLRFAERFYKNGAIVSEAELSAAHRFLQGFAVAREASYFEYATLLALALARGVDYVVLEAGVGGEFDATSALPRDLCLFSVVDFDHEEMLGDTIEKIATTKLKAMQNAALIGAQKHPIVREIAKNIAKIQGVGRLVFLESFAEKGALGGAAETALGGALGANLGAALGEDSHGDSPKDSHKNQAHEITESRNAESEIAAYLERWGLAAFLAPNLALALKGLEMLGLRCDLKTLRRLDLRGRFEALSENIILDVGHNKSAAAALRGALGARRVVLVYNAYFQKDIRGILEILKPNLKRVEIIAVEHKRIIEKSALVGILEALGLAWRDFCGIEKDEFYLVFGSFSVAETFLKRYLKQN